MEEEDGKMSLIKIPKWLRPKSGYKLHIVFGIIISALFYYLVTNENWFKISNFELMLAIPVILLYSILPDVDLANSKIRGILMVTALFITLISVFMGYKMFSIGLLVVLILMQFLEHRKFIHSLISGVLFSIPFVFYSWPLTIFAFISYLSHLLLDGEIKLI